MKEDIAQKLRRYVERSNSRGVSGLFARPTPHDKEWSEGMQFSCWRDAVEHAEGCDLSTWERNPDDPPDYYVTYAGRRVSVELAELVSDEVLALASRTEDRRVTSNAGDGFRLSLWSQEKFFEKVEALIRKKGNNYARNDKQIDILAIVSDEPYLYECDARRWLSELVFSRATNIERVDVVLHYEPGPDGYYPLLRVY